MSKKPRKNKIDVDVSGLSWQDVIELDPMHIRGISTKSLAKMTSRLVSAYNKRAKRLEKSGLAEASPAYRGLMERGQTRLSVKGQNFNELMHTFGEAKRLLTERSTFSVAGTRQLMQGITERIGHEFSSKDEARRYWEAMDKLKESNIGNDKRTSTDTQREVADMMFNEGMSVDDVLEHYGVVMEAETPDIDIETDEMMGYGYDEEMDEDEEFEEETFGEDTPW